MSLIWTILIGLIVGFIAKFIMHGAGPKGFIWTAVLGILGSFLATYVGRATHWYSPDREAGWIASVLGAIVLLIIYKAVVKRTS